MLCNAPARRGVPLAHGWPAWSSTDVLTLARIASAVDLGACAKSTVSVVTARNLAMAADAPEDLAWPPESRCWVVSGLLVITGHSFDVVDA